MLSERSNKPIFGISVKYRLQRLHLPPHRSDFISIYLEKAVGPHVFPPPPPPLYVLAYYLIKLMHCYF